MQNDDALIEAMGVAIAKALYGERFDPFQQPETYAFCDQLARAALTAQRTSQPQMSDEIKALVERARINAAWMDEDCDCNGDKHTQCRWKCLLLAMASCIESQADGTRVDIETRFWSVVDKDGLTGLPSDMWAALETLVNRAATQAEEIERLRAAGLSDAIALVEKFEIQAEWDMQAIGANWDAQSTAVNLVKSIVAALKAAQEEA